MSVDLQLHLQSIGGRAVREDADGASPRGAHRDDLEFFRTGSAGVPEVGRLTHVSLFRHCTDDGGTRLLPRLEHQVLWAVAEVDRHGQNSSMLAMLAAPGPVSYRYSVHTRLGRVARLLAGDGLRHLRWLAGRPDGQAVTTDDLARVPIRRQVVVLLLWHRLLGGSRGAVSENGRLRQGAGSHPGGDRCRSVLMLPTLFEGYAYRLSEERAMTRRDAISFPAERVALVARRLPQLAKISPGTNPWSRLSCERLAGVKQGP